MKRTGLLILVFAGVFVVASCGSDSSKDNSDTASDSVEQGDGLLPGDSDAAQPLECVLGALGCDCLDDGTCNGVTLRCNSSGTCQSTQCPQGTPGCGCSENGECASPASCVGGLCLLDSMLTPPESPQCYTPCREGRLTEDGTYFPCPADGLMPGCLDRYECVDGSCVLRKEEKSDDISLNYDPCITPMDCPDWQTCIQGKCYSICENDMECPGVLQCHRHVCRIACDTGVDCPAGMVCDSDNGAPGFCLHPAASGDDGGTVTATFDISDTAFTFTNADQRVDLEFTNDGPGKVSFVVTPIRHTKFTETGPVDIDSNPLGWMKMGAYSTDTPDESELEPAGSFTFEAADGETVLVGFLDVPEDCELDRWEGVVKVEALVGEVSQGVRWIHLRYMGTAEGSWTGTIHYFANFPTGNLQSWMADKEGYDIKNLDNAFIKRWMAFKDGDIALTEFMAVLNATTSESWKWSSVEERCRAAYNQPNAACYLYADPWGESTSGVGLYTQNLQQDKIPTAATELPFAMNIRQDGSDSHDWVGRIESSGSLHYAGNPEVSLQFQGDPSSCQTTHLLSGTCLTYLDAFDADALLGGRGPAEQGDCALYGSQFSLMSTPWLVPGFESFSVSTGEGTVVQECRDQTVPFGDTSEFHAINQTFSGANPVPNGMPLLRSIRLIDGALVNQKSLVLIFEETFDIALSPTQSENFSSYGVILLNRSMTPLTASDYEGNIHALTGSQSPHFPYSGCSEALSDVVAGYFSDVDISQFILAELPAMEPWETVPGDSACDAATDPQKCRTAVRALASAALDGIPDSAVPPVPLDPTNETAHYYCEDNGTIDQGPVEADAPCPPGSKVEYFTVNHVITDGNAGMHFEHISCNQDYSYQYSVEVTTNNPGTLQSGTNEEESLVFHLMDDNGSPGSCGQWIQNIKLGWQCATVGGPNCAGRPLEDTISCTNHSQCDTNYYCGGGTCKYSYRFDVLWRCSDADMAYCSDDRYDLLEGKEFYADTYQAEVLQPLRSQIEQAFRYKTKFINKSGTSLAFAPRICDPGAGELSYCYAPDEIEAAQDRVECIEYLYSYFAPDILTSDQNLPAEDKLYPRLASFLRQTFSYDDYSTPGIVRDGFERLFSELLIMMGDEAFSQAYASRFDIGGFSAASFPGAALEPNGINLSGGAGFEMYNLYLAVQNYQAALNRFYLLMPTIWESFARLSTDDYYVTQATASHYFERLVRASGQKSRAWSEIARRYQKFNRPDLARQVVERAYTAAYMESVVFNGLFKKMREIYKDTADEEQIVYILEQAQIRYRQGLLEMRDVYRDLSNELTYFGYPPDYVPFPAVENLGAGLWSNAFDKMLEYAKQTASVAAAKEALAIDSGTNYNVDYAAFEAELAKIQASYETQLLELCGSFEGTDGVLYPAIARYASKNPEAEELMALTGELCGLTGSGEIHDAMASLALSKLDSDALRVRHNNLVAQVNIEKERVEAYCQAQLSFADFMYGEDGLSTEVHSLQEQISDSNRAIEDLRRYVDTTGTSCGLVSAGDIYLLGQAIALGVVYDIFNIVTEAVVAGVQIGIATKERKIHDLEEQIGWWELNHECDLALIDSNAVVKGLLLQFAELEIDAMKAEYDLMLKLSKIKQLRSQAQQLQDLEAEAEQHAINIVAAMNDPNVRLYKDDAILAADRTFHRALVAAYKATRVFEYYTSQTYAHLWDLFLVRAVTHGEYNLENYLAELEDAFYEFEEAYGNPDLRVKTLSLCDDILKIPYTDQECGNDGACTTTERAQMLREALKNPELVDANGYLVIPFSTTVSELSPMTYNHKLDSIEVELRGQNFGDDVARFYLRQMGTGTIRSLSGGYQYYAFPKQTAVVDAWINQKVFDPDVYPTYRMKDRPFANTQWELVINLLDEPDNLDLDFWNALTDLKIHLYYMDFTSY